MLFLHLQAAGPKDKLTKPVSEIRNVRQKVLFFVFVLKTLMANSSKICSLGGCCLVVACCTTFFWIVTDVQSKWSTDRVATSALGYMKRRLSNTGFLFIVFKITI
jgi:hypothetical protein